MLGRGSGAAEWRGRGGALLRAEARRRLWLGLGVAAARWVRGGAEKAGRLKRLCRDLGGMIWKGTAMIAAASSDLNARGGSGSGNSSASVSYTHLTLPTIA